MVRRIRGKRIRLRDGDFVLEFVRILLVSPRWLLVPKTNNGQLPFLAVVGLRDQQPTRAPGNAKPMVVGENSKQQRFNEWR